MAEYLTKKNPCVPYAIKLYQTHVKYNHLQKNVQFDNHSTQSGTLFAFFIVQNHTISLRLENSTVTFNSTEANFLYHWRAALLSHKSCNHNGRQITKTGTPQILHNRNFSQQNGSAIFKINIRFYSTSRSGLFFYINISRLSKVVKNRD